MLGSICVLPRTFPRITDSLEAYFSENLKAGDKTALAGDFNVPNIYWTNFSVANNDVNADAFLDLTFSFYLVEVVEEAIWVQGIYRNLLNLLFMSHRLSSFNGSVEVIGGIFGHCALILTLHCYGYIQSGVVC